MRQKHTHMGAKSIDEYAYLSHLKDINSGVKLCFTVAVILISVSSESWEVPILAVGICSIITVGFGKIHLSDYISLLTVPITFLVMSAVAIAISLDFNGGFEIAFHQSDVFRAIVVSVKALGAVSAMYVLSLSTPMDDIISLLGRLKLPEVLCELMRLMYKYIFILADAQVRMRNSAESRLGYDGFVRSLKTFGLICSNLLAVSLRKATDYYNAVESRSFGGRLKFLGSSKPVKFVHLVAFGGCCLLLVCMEMLFR